MYQQPGSGLLSEIASTFLRLGVIGFGGPAAHIALMEDEFVHRRKWVDRQRFLDALSVTNMVPGPNSTEMAIHLGYLRAGLAGGLIAGICFISPAFLIILALSWAYFEFGSLPQIGWLFYAVKPAIIAIIVVTAYRLAKSAVGDWRLGGLALAALATTVVSPGLELPALIVAGLLGIVLYTRPLAGFPGYGLLMGSFLTAMPIPDVTLPTLLGLAWVFFKTGALLFGGGFVMIPLIEHDVVNVYGWLSASQFVDGVALGQSTPGPIVITAAFVGYAAAGVAGAAIATAAIFLPAFAIVLAGTGPFLGRLRRSETARAFLKGVNAAVVGTILGAGILLARSAVTDLLTGAILAIALVALVRLKVGTMPLIGSAAVLGVLVSLLGLAGGKVA